MVWPHSLYSYVTRIRAGGTSGSPAAIIVISPLCSSVAPSHSRCLPRITSNNRCRGFYIMFLSSVRATAVHSHGMWLFADKGLAFLHLRINIFPLHVNPNITLRITDGCLNDRWKEYFRLRRIPRTDILTNIWCTVFSLLTDKEMMHMYGIVYVLYGYEDHRYSTAATNG